jgi:voltage-gated potassium channel Kch
LALFQLAAPEAGWAQFVVILLGGSVLVISLETARVAPRLRRIVVGPVALLLIASAVALLSPIEIGDTMPRVVALLFVGLTPVAIVVGLGYQLREDGSVTLQSMFAGLCIYLLIAMAFSFAFGVLDDIGDPFFADGRSGTTSNLLYFSFTTMTTTGYGDFTAATEVGRAFAVTEALLGQVYLVTVVALIVANLGRRRVPAGEHQPSSGSGARAL